MSYPTSLQQGHYAADNFYFFPPGPGANGVDSGPLHALSHTEAGGSPDDDLRGDGNGVFAIGAGSRPIVSGVKLLGGRVFTPASEPPQVLSVNPRRERPVFSHPNDYGRVLGTARQRERVHQHSPAA